MAGPADFLAALDAWVAKADAAPDTALRAIAEAALETVKSYTPVDTGNLRANWSIVPGGTELPIVAHAERDTARGTTDTPLTLDLSAIKAGDILRIVNPVAYARPVEFGWSIKLKDGGERHVEGRFMATRTVAELPAIAERAIARLGSGAP